MVSCFIDNRIISYTECDDPTQNHITIGVFVRDNASLAIETDRVANSALNSAASANETADAAKEKADNSVQQGEKYSNVSITHKDGFMAVNKSGTQRVMMNADDCFVVQTLQNGEWVTVNSLESWGILTPRLTTQDAKNLFYATVGKNASGIMGITLYFYNGSSFVKELFLGTDNVGSFLESAHALTFQASSFKFKDLNGNEYGATGTFNTANSSILKIKNGLITDWE